MKTITVIRNFAEFHLYVSSQKGLPKLTSDDWGSLFHLLAPATGRERVSILLDEISWMASGDPPF